MIFISHRDIPTKQGYFIGVRARNIPQPDSCPFEQPIVSPQQGHASPDQVQPIPEQPNAHAAQAQSNPEEPKATPGLCSLANLGVATELHLARVQLYKRVLSGTLAAHLGSTCSPLPWQCCLPKRLSRVSCVILEALLTGTCKGNCS